MSNNRQTTLKEYWGPQDSESDEDSIHLINQNNFKNKLTIISINIGDNLLNKINAVNEFLISNKTDILFLLEVHSFQEDMNNLTQNFFKLGYDIHPNCVDKPVNNLFTYSNKRKSVKGGVIVLIKTSCQIKKVENIIKNSGIRVNIKWENEELDILGLYAPSSCEPYDLRNLWWNNLYNITINLNNHKLIIGDLNIHIIEELDHKKENSCPHFEAVENLLCLVNDIWREKHLDKIISTFSRGYANT